MGAPRPIDVYRMIGPPNQGGNGIGGRTFGWIEDYGTYRTRLAPNGSGDHGSFFNQGETWYGILAARIAGAGSAPQGTENFHDVPAPGKNWGAVSPLRWDEYGPNGFGFFGTNRGEYTLEYSGGCPGFAGNYHFDTDPITYDDYIFHFVEAKFETACTGILKVWQQFLSAPSLADGPIVNLTNAITLNPDPTWYGGVQFWHGMYIPHSFYFGPNVQIDRMLSMWGQSWQQAWDDAPTFFRFQSDSSTGNYASCLLLETLNTGNFPVPNDVAAFLSDPPGPPIPPGAPVPLYAVVVGSVITVTFNQNLDPAFVSPPTQFVVMRNGSAVPIIATAVPGDNTCIVTLATPFAFGDTGSISYYQS